MKAFSVTRSVVGFVMIAALAACTPIERESKSESPDASQAKLEEILLRATPDDAGVGAKAEALILNGADPTKPTTRSLTETPETLLDLAVRSGNGPAINQMREAVKGQGRELAAFDEALRQALERSVETGILPLRTVLKSKLERVDADIVKIEAEDAINAEALRDLDEKLNVKGSQQPCPAPRQDLVSRREVLTLESDRLVKNYEKLVRIRETLQSSLEDMDANLIREISAKTLFEQHKDIAESLRQTVNAMRSMTGSALQRVENAQENLEEGAALLERVSSVIEVLAAGNIQIESPSL